LIKSINSLCGIKESDTGLSLPSMWNLEGDKVLLSEQVINSNKFNFSPCKWLDAQKS
jgi:hypothetical protein